MSEAIIKVENLSKRFLISHESRQSYHSIREEITLRVQSLFSNRKKLLTGKQEEFWALRDVSFEVHKGDRIGIIGRNGAGKSTLLKILSRITDPTHGKVTLCGKVASLLEVGTGFHPELTGRENIFLNGAILGMSRREIRTKFDEIVAFAEVEKFLDTPVKRYSSGMYVRLAFAVAAHLEPDILVIDEVLAVGDAAFQKKCLGKMEDVSKNEGRTILFVSHSMPTIASLCNRCILLASGKISAIGNPSDIIVKYYNDGAQSSLNIDYSANLKMPGDSYARLRKIKVLVDGDVATHEIDIRKEILILLEYEILYRDEKLLAYPNIHVFDAMGSYVFVSAPETTFIHDQSIYESYCRIPGNYLNQGTYFIGAAIGSFGSGLVVHVFEHNAVSFNIRDNIEDVPTRLHVNGEIAYAGDVPGLVRPLLQWKINKSK